LHGGGLLLGVFYAVDGAAVILGSVLAVRLRRGSHLAAYALAYALQGAAWGAMFLGGGLAWSAALLAVMRTASGVIIALDTTILLATVPERLRGRITSLHMTTYGAASKVALAAFAGLLAVTEVRTAGIVAGAASVIVGAAWWALNGRLDRPLYINATSAAEAPNNPDTAPSALEATGQPVEPRAWGRGPARWRGPAARPLSAARRRAGGRPRPRRLRRSRWRCGWPR
jgi:hypothetical protein